MQRGDPKGSPSFASQSQNKFVLNYKLIIMRNFRLFLAVFLAACTFASCQEEIIKDAIVLDSSSSDDLIQVLESGETRGSSITFTTSGAWTSEIKSVAPRTKASPDWISLKPDHGNAAGDYTVDVVLSENETYSDRAAEIIIKSGDKSITMDITQKASPFVPVTAVKLSASSLALTEGDVARLTATVEPADATDKTVVWSSDSPEIAEVDQEGNVTAKSEGEAVITAVCGEVSADCEVVVAKHVIPVTAVKLSASSLALTEGDVARLTATVEPADATDKTVVWSSDSPEIAEVDQEGNVTAKSEGEAVITAVSGDVSGTCTVVVSKRIIPVTSVAVIPEYVELTEGDSKALMVRIQPSDATDKTVVWSSDAPEIVEVSDGGRITAISEGTAVITATSGDVSGTCTVVVSKRIIPVTSVAVIPEYVELTEGDSKALMVRIQPSDATDKTVVWSSDAPEIVEVSDGGRITAISEGTAVITATSGDVSGTCTVVVSKPYIPVSSVKINLSSLELTQGEVVSLTVTVEPANATDKTVVWRSDDSDVASVDQEGNVTAVSQGNTVITAECGDMSATCVVTVFPAELHYVDEYGIDHGPGILISTYSYGDIVWAPVNCGYHATDYKYGKLYQWGRKYGQGYDGSDAIAPVIAEGGVTLAEGQDPDNANTYFKGAGNDWLGVSDDKLWNSGTEDAPVKTENDPCPDGWRVPTYNELKSIQSRKSSWTTNDEGQNGYWFTDSNDPSQTFFMPAAGLISGASWKAGKPDDRGSDGYYWSSKPYNNGAANMQSISKYSVSGSSSYRCYGYSVRCVKE